MPLQYSSNKVKELNKATLHNSFALISRYNYFVLDGIHTIIPHVDHINI